MAENAGSPRQWPPLGLPVGSVRALLTLIIVGVVVLDLVRGRDPDVLWIETLLIAMAHYFTSRRFVALPGDVIRRLEQEGVLEDERQPLFLPRHTIRTLIVGSFVGVAVYLYREGRLFEPRVVSLLGIVFAYLLGTFVRGITSWFRRGKSGPASRFWGDARAVIVLGSLAVIAVPEMLGESQILPAEAHKIALGLVLFYFGSR